MEEYSEMIWKIWMKGKRNSNKIGKIQKKRKMNCDKIWKVWKKNKFVFDYPYLHCSID